jgi:hypothetical protein
MTQHSATCTLFLSDSASMQVRGTSTRDKQCKASFAKLVTTCVSSLARATQQLDTGATVPFGRDPAFNPRTSLYASGVDESTFYNVSSGSSELSALGYPLGFFPLSQKDVGRAGSIRDGFPVVFPVRTPLMALLMQYCPTLCAHSPVHGLC